MLVYGNAGLRVKARTRNQQKLVEAVETNDMVFAIGPAGTGKTYTAVALAVRALKERQGPAHHPHAACGGSGGEPRFPAR